MHIIRVWIERTAETLLQKIAAHFPAVLVTGARQTGKTSLLRHAFPNAAYLTLDLPAAAEAAVSAPDELLDKLPEPLIIDEIQYAPSLMRHLKARIDKQRRPGRFLLTGSQTFALMQGVSESLAGRCGLLELHTLSHAELVEAGLQTNEKSYVFMGGYPELHVGADHGLWFPSYVATYLERDVRNVLRVVDLQDFNRFIRACALRIAQMLNYSDIARDSGIAPNTARKWLSVLQASSVVTLVEPFFGNRTKRLIKTPKLMFLDTGLAAFLAGFTSAESLFSSGYAGAFWEAHVYGQVRRAFANLGLRTPICYWQTASGHEVDLVIEIESGSLIAIDCKCKEKPDLKDSANLRVFRETEGKRLKQWMIVARTPETYRLADGTWVTDVNGCLKRIFRNRK